jgi:3-isopropylmalate/(R)-2-methylmalate dehydratase small subunit
MQDAESGSNATMTVDLATQEITRSNGEKIAFEVDAFRKHCILNGLDDIGMTLEKEEKIKAFEERRALATPWMASLINK